MEAVITIHVLQNVISYTKIVKKCSSYIKVNTNIGKYLTFFSHNESYAVCRGFYSLVTKSSYLASEGLYVTSYFSTRSAVVDQDTRTVVGFRNVTVIFSGTPGLIEPVKR